jgi:hypothetical protein
MAYDFKKYGFTRPILYSAVLGLCISLSSGCAGKNALPTTVDYNNRSTTSDVISDYEILLSNDHFERRPNQQRLEHLIKQLSTLKGQEGISRSAEFLYATMIATTSAAIYNSSSSGVRSGIDYAILTTKEQLEKGMNDSFLFIDQLNQGLDSNKRLTPEQAKTLLEENLRTFGTIKQYLEDFSNNRLTDETKKEFSERMEFEKKRWTTNGTYNNHGFYDEMKIIDLDTILRTSEKMIIDRDYIRAIGFCEIIKKHPEVKRSHLFPRAMIIEAEAYKRLVEDTNAEPLNVMTGLDRIKPYLNQNTTFTEVLIESLQQAQKIPGAPIEDYNNYISALRELPMINGQLNERKKTALIEAMQLQQRLNLFAVKQRYGDSPEGEIARAELMLLEAYRKRDSHIGAKLID